VTKPFEYEGEKMTETANKGIEELRKEVDTLIVVQNEKIFSIASDDISMREAYNIANDVLYRATKGIAEIVTKHGHVNGDFADVRNVMSDAGDAVMGSATASGDSRAVEAAAQAISSPLLDGVSIKGSTHILVNITGDVKIRDMKEALSFIKEQAGPGAQIIHGVVEDETTPGEITVTVIATGFSKKKPAVPQNPQGLHVVRRNEMLKATNGVASASSNGVSLNGTTGASNVEEKLGRINSDVFEKRDELPAFIRAGNQLPIPLEQKKIEEKLGEEKFAMAALEPRFSSDQDRIRKTNSDTPAFLRKILD
jgi:cell division protein FtsZ